MATHYPVPRRIGLCPAWPVYSQDKVDFARSLAMWAADANRCVHHVLFSSRCADRSPFVITVLPCMGYVLIGNELYAGSPRTIMCTVPYESPDRAYITTVWQYLYHAVATHPAAFGVEIRSLFQEQLTDVFSMRFTQPHGASVLHRPIRLYRFRSLHDQWQAFMRLGRFLRRRAILRKIKDAHFTKLKAFAECVAAGPWHRIYDSELPAALIYQRYLLGPDAVSAAADGIQKLRGEELIQTEGRVQLR